MVDAVDVKDINGVQRRRNTSECDPVSEEGYKTQEYPTPGEEERGEEGGRAHGPHIWDAVRSGRVAGPGAQRGVVLAVLTASLDSIS